VGIRGFHETKALSERLAEKWIGRKVSNMAEMRKVTYVYSQARQSVGVKVSYNGYCKQDESVSCVNVVFFSRSILFISSEEIKSR
jgi:hypothetical protein